MKFTLYCNGKPESRKRLVQWIIDAAFDIRSKIKIISGKHTASCVQSYGGEHEMWFHSKRLSCYILMKVNRKLIAKIN